MELPPSHPWDYLSIERGGRGIQPVTADQIPHRDNEETIADYVRDRMKRLKGSEGARMCFEYELQQDIERYERLLALGFDAVHRVDIHDDVEMGWCVALTLKIAHISWNRSCLRILDKITGGQDTLFSVLA